MELLQARGCWENCTIFVLGSWIAHPGLGQPRNLLLWIRKFKGLVGFFISFHQCCHICSSKICSYLFINFGYMWILTRKPPGSRSQAHLGRSGIKAPNQNRKVMKHPISKDRKYMKDHESTTSTTSDLTFRFSGKWLKHVETFRMIAINAAAAFAEYFGEEAMELASENRTWHWRVPHV